MLGVGLIGLGYWGPKVLRNLRDHPGVEVRSLHDANRAAAERNARGSEVVTSDLADVLGDPEIAAVVIATPSSTHAVLVEEALACGKHVLVEKPLARTLSEADALVHAASRAGRVLMVGHTYLFNPAIQRLRGSIVAGEIGAVTYLTSTRTNLGPIRADVSAVFDLASHDVAIIAHLFGEFPSRVSATGGSWITPGIYDAAFASLMFPDGRIARVEVSWLHPRKERRIVIVGKSGMMTFDDLNADRPIEVFDKSVAMNPAVHGTEFPTAVRVGDINAPFVPMKEPLAAEIEAFVGAIRGESSFLSGAAFGRDVVAVLEAIEHSINREGAAVEVQYAE